MKQKPIILVAALAALGALLLPSAAFAAGPTIDVAVFQLNTLWMLLAAVLVIFMQAGFAFLEIGFSRGKNAGTIVAKILVNMSVAAIVYFVVGYSLAFTEGNAFIGGLDDLFVSGVSGGTTDAADGYSGWAFWIFQYAFCAVSLAIVWGTTLERIKFGVYVIYGIVFAGFIYPAVSHWVWAADGWLFTDGVQDFAGSSVVHLTGATAGLAATLLLGARKGKYVDGKARAIPGHNMPLFGLACLILLVGWFGFNPGSQLSADGRIAEIGVVTLLGGVAGVIGALIMGFIIMKTIDIGMVGNGLIAGLVAITAPSGYVFAWAALPIGLVAGVVVVLGVFMFEKLRIDDPVGALSAHGLAGIWGTLSCGIFTAKVLTLEGQSSGLIYGGGFDQLLTQTIAVVATFAFVFAASFIVFAIIKATYGLRVTEAEEDAGLDISEHGMYGYPEQFIPASELVGPGMPGTPSHASSVLAEPPTSSAPAGAGA